MKFNPEEIKLCKQIADTGERRALRFGDFWIHSDGNQCIHVVYMKESVISLMEQQVIACYPLWTLSDCLEFLNDRAFYLEGLCQTDECEYECNISEMDEMGLIRHTKRHFEGKTLLEACLKAVLAVLEETK